MRRVALIALFALATSLGHGRELTPLAGSPQWRVGDTWHVLTRPRRFGPNPKTGAPTELRRKQPIRVTYEVKGIVDVDGERCFEIEMTQPSRPGHAYFCQYAAPIVSSNH